MTKNESMSSIETGRLYLRRQASSIGRYILEQTLYLLVGWIPTVIGIGVRGILYRLILHMDGICRH